MDELKASGKPFQISKEEVWDAWIKVKGNKGGCSTLKWPHRGTSIWPHPGRVGCGS